MLIEGTQYDNYPIKNFPKSRNFLSATLMKEIQLAVLAEKEFET